MLIFSTLSCVLDIEGRPERGKASIDIFLLLKRETSENILTDFCVVMTILNSKFLILSHLNVFLSHSLATVLPVETFFNQFMTAPIGVVL